MRSLLGLVLMCGVASAQPAAQGPVVRLEGHQVVGVQIRTLEDVRFMQAIGADQWSHRVRRDVPTLFMVSPEQRAALDERGLVYEVSIPDVQAQIDEENARLGRGGAGRAWFDDFKDLDAINDYLDTLASSRPDIASTVELGVSIEGRPVRALRLSNDAYGDIECKPTIIINACQHAREWIAPMVGMYIADRMLAEYGSGSLSTVLINRSEVLIVPVVNPDGYDYTWTNYRLWRKNRRDNGNGTFGVDLNRNWGVGWGLDNGSSGNGSSGIYRGTAPFSEPETRHVRDLALSSRRLAAQIDLHSFGQLILAPWGYTGDLPPGHDTFQMLGSQMQQTIASVHGRNYRHGPCYHELYPISGGEGDWFWGEAGAHNFLIELRGSGFILPPDQIIPNGEEIYPAALDFANWARDQHRPRADYNDDARIDTQDVLAYINLWRAAEPSTDFNGDGVVDTRDVVIFLNEWVAGC